MPPVDLRSPTGGFCRTGSCVGPATGNAATELSGSISICESTADGVVVADAVAFGGTGGGDAAASDTESGGVAVIGAVVGSGAANGTVAVAGAVTSALAKGAVARAGGVTPTAVNGTVVVAGAAASGLDCALLARAAARSTADTLFDAVDAACELRCGAPRC